MEYQERATEIQYIDTPEIRYYAMLSDKTNRLTIGIESFPVVPKICDMHDNVRIHFDSEGKIGFHLDAKCIGFSRITNLPIFDVCERDSKMYKESFIYSGNKPSLTCIEKVNLGSLYKCEVSGDSNSFRVVKIDNRSGHSMVIEDGRLSELYIFKGARVMLTFKKRMGVTKLIGDVESFIKVSGRISVKFLYPIPSVDINTLVKVEVMDAVPFPNETNKTSSIGNISGWDVSSVGYMSHVLNSAASPKVTVKKKQKVNEIKRSVKLESKVKFTVGKEYKLRRKSLYSMTEKRYICKGIVWKIKNEPVGIVVMKCTEDQPGEYIFTLGKHDCRRLHIKFEPGLQVFSIKERFIEVKKY